MSTGSHADLMESLQALAEAAASGCGLELVELRLRGSSRRRTLRVDIDRAGPRGVGIDDCQTVSRALEAALDESGLLSEDYVLEVSSPGADRPIRTEADIRRNTGRAVVVTTAEPIEGRTRFPGRLEGSEGGCIVLAEQGAERGEVRVRIPLERVRTIVQDLGV